ncbi:MAG: 4Fe-4S binding protein [Treponema sp.]|jgi:iron only hydrogenase large subunit-like protein/signal transduction histidine kinase|nr:4Fe-4S binding protein [Treponema sp.]
MGKEKLTPVIKLDNEKCVNCYACITACPVKYCIDGSGSVLKINHDLCIGCGHCIIACTHNARMVLDDGEAFFKALEQKEKMIAIIAPAVVANFPDTYRNLNGYLQSLGVEAVFDVSFGAELTVFSYMQYIREGRPDLVIAQPCPAIVTYIELYHPELLPYLAPADSPMLHTMRMIQEYYPAYAHHRIAIISPCMAKRREFDELGLGDYNVTFISLKKHLEEQRVDLASFPAMEYAGPPAERGVTFSEPGGLLITADREMPGIWERTRQIEGVHTVYPYLKHLAETLEQGGETFFLVDCLNCEKGCNGGPGTGNAKTPRTNLEIPIQRRRRAMEAHYNVQDPSPPSPEKGRKKLNEILTRYWKPGLYTRTYQDRSAQYTLKEPTPEQLTEVYRSMGKYRQQDIYNCTSCGYGSCQEMAFAIFNKLNQPRNCHHYNLFLLKREHRLTQKLTQELQGERDEITVMKDNLRVGLFLMDRGYAIQPQYSKALERVLAVKDLQRKNFIDLVSASISPKEQEGLQDYFTMVFDRAFDQKMLEDINPLQEFTYINPQTKEGKNLRTTFALVDRGHDIVFILGTLEDITAEKKLQQELAASENKRQEEMQSLFEVIQVDPRVLHDFIEDTDYEFERINELLKNRALSSKLAMVEIFQAVHAMKSNALILGLDTFSNKLHDLESNIKKMQAQEDIPFEAVLHIALALEKIMQEQDKLRIAIERINSFKGKGRKQNEYVLVDSLQKACEKAAQALDKKVRFVADALDPQAMDRGPRRLMKEVLTQLVRNAVYHGIEPPAERCAQGKDAAGIIYLAIQGADHAIHLKLQDDGRGLDFDKIREKAERMHLLRNQADAQDKNYLLRTIFEPGFSTAEVAGIHAGRGIGLNLVRDRIREVRGLIKVQSQPGKGTAFNIYIPIETLGE